MANYTTLDKKEIENLISQYAVGDVLDYSVMKGGAANSSFKVRTNKGKYVLTIWAEF